MDYNYYYIITIGCQMNKSDSERLANFLQSHGLEQSESVQADLVIINTCGVRQSAEDRVYGLVNQIKHDNPKAKIIITGCLSRRADVISRLKKVVNLFMPIDKLPDLFTFLDSQQLIATDSQREIKGEEYLKITPAYGNNFSAFVPIGNGCNNFCAYCVVPYARGREVYRPYNEILSEVKDLVSQGYKEINLIAQNVNSYRYQDHDFADLLLEVNSLSGNFWIRFSSSHPKDMSDKLITAIGQADKLTEHLHLAVQSGDNDILKKMNRNYTIERYQNLIDKIKQVRPDMAITTDVIVGFPTESRQQFRHTKQLFRKMKFDLVYISQYSPRPQTAAFKMKDNVSPVEKKRRENKLNKILIKTSRHNNKQSLGKEYKILVEAKGKLGEYVGKGSNYRTVRFKSKEDNLIGEFVKVKITAYQNFGLSGELVK